MKAYLSLLFLTALTVFFPFSAFCSDEAVAETLMQSNKLVSVIVVLAIILAGIIVFLIKLDNRVKEMEKSIH